MTIVDYNYYVDIRESSVEMVDVNQETEILSGFHIDLNKSEVHSNGELIPDKIVTLYTTLDENDANKIKRLVSLAIKKYIELSKRKEYIGE